MPAETIALDVRRRELSTAAYLVIVAYPNPTERRKLEQFRLALLAWWDRERSGHGQLPPDLLRRLRAMSDDKVHTLVNRGIGKIVKRRLPAVGIAMGLHLDEALKDTHWAVRVNGKRPSVNTLVAQVARQLSTVPQQANVMSRAWTESKPVVHLGVPLHSLLGAAAQPNKTANILDLFEQDWLERAIAFAEIARLAYCANERFSIKEELTIQVKNSDRLE